MFFFPYTINGIRQALIISISIYLIHKLSFENYNFKKLFLISFLSIFIHASGIFLLVFLLIRRIKITPFFIDLPNNRINLDQIFFRRLFKLEVQY